MTKVIYDPNDKNEVFCDIGEGTYFDYEGTLYLLVDEQRGIVFDFEKEMPFYKDCTTVWIDYFNGDGPTIQKVIETLKDGKIACVVSPELHKRDYQQMWEYLKPMKGEERLYLCTDYPDKAKEYFK